MADESTNNQVESDKIEPENDVEEAHPIERITISKGPPKISSRYLSGPRGSCHDFCKYGIQHAAVEAKPWTKANKRLVASTENRKTKVQEENVTSLAGTKKPVSNSKPYPNSPVDIREVINEKTVYSEKNSPPFEGTAISIEHNDSDLRQAQHSEPSPLPVKQSSKNQTKRKTVKSRSAFGSSSIKQTRPPLTGEKEKSMPTSSPLSSKHEVKKPSSSSANKTAKDLTSVSSLKDHENVKEAKPELANDDNIPDKILNVVEPTSTNLSEEPTPSSDETKLSSSSPSASRNKSLKQTSKKTGNSGVSAPSRKALRHVGHGSRSSISVSLSSFGSKGKESLSVSRSTTISSSSSITSHVKHNGAATSKFNKTGNGGQGEKVKVGYRVKPRMSTIVGAANKVAPARKLTFRRGRVIEIQPQINNIPRRLKFRPRPACPLGDDIHRDINDARNRKIAIKEDDAGESNVANVKQEKVGPRFRIVEGGKKRIIVGRPVGGDRSKTDGSKPTSDERVVLRHQNVEGKKANPRLYNNVIEETASMLAELRKSKVKALVGAFETVISLDSPRESTTPAEVSTPC